MKTTTTLLCALLGFCSYCQDKSTSVSFNKLTEVEGTKFVIATVNDMSKKAVFDNYLLFINTADGQTRQIDFPKGGYIENFQQVKIDSLGINKIIAGARTINLDNDKSIDWNDPKQLIVLSTDGLEKTQLTDDNFFVNTWTINRQTGAIIVTGHHDTNNNKKLDRNDEGSIMVYDLKTLKLISKVSGKQ